MVHWLLIEDGAQVDPGTTIAEWDPFAIPILTEVGGVIKFQDITEGVTVNEEFDEVTGLSRKVVVESRDAEHRPQVVIRDPSTNQVLKLGSARGEARYLLPVGANIVVRDGDAIEQGQPLQRFHAKRPRRKTLLVVCPELQSFSRLGSPEIQLLSVRLTVGWNSERIPRASGRSSCVQKWGSLKSILLRRAKRWQFDLVTESKRASH